MDLTMKPMKPEERLYTEMPGTKLCEKTGCIGCLTGKLDDHKTDSDLTWEVLCDGLEPDDFVDDLDEVVDRLKNDGALGNPFRNRMAMLAFCYSSLKGGFGKGSDLFGYRVDTERYAFLLRLDPHSHEQNLSVYCYQRDKLDRHIRDAARGIRFLSPEHNEKFRIADGDMIRVTSADGKVQDHKCRYLDDYNLEIDQERFHIIDFRDYMEGRGCTVIPLRASLPPKCFSVASATDELIIIVKGERGYIPAGMKGDDMTARESADALNEAMDVTKAQEAAMSAGSMFGWDVPAADPKNYDEKGLPIKPRHKNRDEAR